jgi:hypothetical protein
MFVSYSTPQKLATLFCVADMLQINNTGVHPDVCQVCVLLKVAAFVS